MPATRLQKSVNKWQELGRLIAGAVVFDNRDRREICRACGFCEATYYNRIKDPGSFTLEEISKLGRQLGLKIEDLRAAAIRF